MRSGITRSSARWLKAAFVVLVGEAFFIVAVNVAGDCAGAPCGSGISPSARGLLLGAPIVVGALIAVALRGLAWPVVPLRVLGGLLLALVVVMAFNTLGGLPGIRIDGLAVPFEPFGLSFVGVVLLLGPEGRDDAAMATAAHL